MGGLVCIVSYGCQSLMIIAPSRGLLRDYEPSDGTFSSTTALPVLVMVLLTMEVVGGGGSCYK